MPEQPSGGLANAEAYANLPRKYSPLMKVKTSPMVAPSVDLSRWASVERAFFRNRKPARFPEQWAGESRKIRWPGGMEPDYTHRSRCGRRLGRCGDRVANTPLLDHGVATYVSALPVPRSIKRPVIWPASFTLRADHSRPVKPGPTRSCNLYMTPSCHKTAWQTSPHDTPTI